eukprot:INCI16171.2.p1 GENE.INCI16171.2~~INCI16171.2.p1  ORF type:complete len:1284 (+),score=197.26 INCI16171.2:259-4110(+)
MKAASKEEKWVFTPLSKAGFFFRDSHGGTPPTAQQSDPAVPSGSGVAPASASLETSGTLASDTDCDAAAAAAAATTAAATAVSRTMPEGKSIPEDLSPYYHQPAAGSGGGGVYFSSSDDEDDHADEVNGSDEVDCRIEAPFASSSELSGNGSVLSRSAAQTTTPRDIAAGGLLAVGGDPELKVLSLLSESPRLPAHLKEHSKQVQRQMGLPVAQGVADSDNVDEAEFRLKELLPRNKSSHAKPASATAGQPKSQGNGLSKKPPRVPLPQRDVPSENVVAPKSAASAATDSTGTQRLTPLSSDAPAFVLPSPESVQGTHSEPFGDNKVTATVSSASSSATSKNTTPTSGVFPSASTAVEESFWNTHNKGNRYAAAMAQAVINGATVEEERNVDLKSEPRACFRQPAVNSQYQQEGPQPTSLPQSAMTWQQWGAAPYSQQWVHDTSQRCFYHQQSVSGPGAVSGPRYHEGSRLLPGGGSRMSDYPHGHWASNVAGEYGANYGYYPPPGMAGGYHAAGQHQSVAGLPVHGYAVSGNDPAAHSRGGGRSRHKNNGRRKHKGRGRHGRGREHSNRWDSSRTNRGGNSNFNEIKSSRQETSLRHQEDRSRSNVKASGHGAANRSGKPGNSSLSLRPLEDFKGWLVDAMKDRFGSVLIQHHIRSWFESLDDTVDNNAAATSSNRSNSELSSAHHTSVANDNSSACQWQWVLEELGAQSRAREAARDPHGNYVVSLLLKSFESDLRTEPRRLLVDIIGQFSGHMVELAMHPNASRVLQTALGVLAAWANVDLRRRLVTELCSGGRVVECIHDRNGNHVVQFVIRTAQSPGDYCTQELQPVFDECLQAGLASLARHVYGCRVVQQMLTRVWAAWYHDELQRASSRDASMSATLDSSTMSKGDCSTDSKKSSGQVASHSTLGRLNSRDKCKPSRPKRGRPIQGITIEDSALVVVPDAAQSPRVPFHLPSPAQRELQLLAEQQKEAADVPPGFPTTPGGTVLASYLEDLLLQEAVDERRFEAQEAAVVAAKAAAEAERAAATAATAARRQQPTNPVVRGLFGLSPRCDERAAEATGSQQRSAFPSTAHAQTQSQPIDEEANNTTTSENTTIVKVSTAKIGVCASAMDGQSQPRATCQPAAADVRSLSRHEWNFLKTYGSHMLRDLSEDLASLCRSKFGNYVVSHVLKGPREVCKVFVNELHNCGTELLLKFAEDKHASNIVELYSRLCDKPQFDSLVDALVDGQTEVPANSSLIVFFAGHPFANYVLQQVRPFFALAVIYSGQFCTTSARCSWR